MARGGMPRAKQPASIGGVERALAGFNAEIGQKMALVLFKFHGDYVKPLEDRIAWLELSWWRKLVVKAWNVWEWTKAKLGAGRRGDLTAAGTGQSQSQRPPQSDNTVANPEGVTPEGPAATEHET